MLISVAIGPSVAGMRARTTTLGFKLLKLEAVTSTINPQRGGVA